MNIKNIKKSTAVLSAAAVGFSLTGCTDYDKLLENDQGKYISLAAKDTLTALVKADESGIFSQLGSALESGSTYFTVDSETSGVAVYFSGSENTEYQLFGASVSSDNGEMDVKFSADKQKIAAAVTGPASNYAYSVFYDTFADKLDSSIFGVNSGSSYALDEDTANSLKEAIDTAKAKVSEAEISSNDKYSEYIDRIEISAATSDITIEGETVSADIITYSIDSTLFDDIIVDYYRESYSSFYSEEDWAEAEQQIRDEFDANMSVSFNINRNSHMLMSIVGSADITSDGESISIDGGLVFGAAPDKSDKISLYANAASNGEAFSYNADLFKGVQNGDLTTWNADYTLSENGSTETASSVLSYNKADGTMLFTLTSSDGESITADCSVTSDSNGTSFTVNSVTDANGNNTLDGKTIGITFSNSPVAAINADKEFLDITEEELNSMGESISNDFSTVLNLY